LSDGPLTFRRAAAELGWGDTRKAGRRLRGMVLARERDKGAKIAARGPGRHRPIRGVTLSAIAEHLPELRPSRLSELGQKFRDALAEIDDNIRRVARAETESAITDLVNPQLAELRARDEEIAANLNELAARVLLSTRKTA
jgi:hypothetical protein